MGSRGVTGIEESGGVIIIRRSNGPDVIFTYSGMGYLPEKEKKA